MKTAIDCIVLYNNPTAKDIFKLSLQFKKGEDIIPGQFFQVKVPRADLILRRPFSVNIYDKNTGVLDIVYQIKGEGTKALSMLKNDQKLNVFGPFGNGFCTKNAQKIWVIGGGIGCAPLLYLPKYYSNVEFELFAGFRNIDFVYQVDEFKTLFNSATILTDDGSFGEKGFVTDYVKKRLEKGERPDAVFACGPVPMYVQLKKIVSEYQLKCDVSLEERMGCGVGACMGCACLIEKDSERSYKRVCADGPVFDINEVVFDA